MMKLKITTPRFKKQRTYDLFLSQENAPLSELAKRVARDTCVSGAVLTFYNQDGKKLDPDQRVSDQVSDGDKLHLAIT